jgi:hypothetical protein
MVKNGKVDKEDPILKEILWSAGLKFEETYLMVRQAKEKIANPVDDTSLTYVFRYERPIRKTS